MRRQLSKMAEPIRFCIGIDDSGKPVNILVPYKTLSKCKKYTNFAISHMECNRKIVLLYAHLLMVEMLYELSIHDRLFKRDYNDINCVRDGRIKVVTGGYFTQGSILKPHCSSRYDFNLRTHNGSKYVEYKAIKYLKY